MEKGEIAREPRGAKMKYEEEAEVAELWHGPIDRKHTLGAFACNEEVFSRKQLQVE